MSTMTRYQVFGSRLGSWGSACSPVESRELAMRWLKNHANWLELNRLLGIQDALPASSWDFPERNMLAIVRLREPKHVDVFVTDLNTIADEIELFEVDKGIVL